MMHPFLAAALASALSQQAAVLPVIDPFGVAELYRTKTTGRSYFATSWNNGRARQFTDAVDPMDGWFDATHGSGHYSIDGKGTLTATGDTVRMYVRNPDQKTEWRENVEITVYVTRVSESQVVSYSGPQIFARTNHGTFLRGFDGEEDTLCDDRGLGAKLNLDGTWAFEKETRHGDADGYATAASKRWWSGGFPVGYPVGLKYVVRNLVDADAVPGAVRVTLYVDMTKGSQGGQWSKVTEYTDAGQWGADKAPCTPGADPAVLPVRPRLLEDSETGRPNLAVIFRHEYATMRYQKLSIREIDPLPIG